MEKKEVIRIKDTVAKIRQALFGAEIRETIASGFEKLETDYKFLKSVYKFIVAFLILQEIAIIILALTLIRLQLQIY